MLTLIATAFTWLKETRWAQYALAAILAAIAFAWWLDGVRDKAVEDDRAKAAAVIAERQAQAVASGAAVQAVEAARIAQGNEHARAAASGSADPLKAGFEALRK